MIEVDISKAVKRVSAVSEFAPQALWSALIVEAENVLAAAKKECPVDTGVLRASGYVDHGLPPSAVKDINISVGFGGAASAYAMIQHENLEFEHTVGKAKYLEDPFNRAKRGLNGRVAARALKYLRDHGVS